MLRVSRGDLGCLDAKDTRPGSRSSSGPGSSEHEPSVTAVNHPEIDRDSAVSS